MRVDDAFDAPVVGVAFEGPRAQRRVTVFFRLILAIPLLIWGALLALAGFFTLPVAWIIALFLGRLPAGLHRFLAGIVEYLTRLYGYSSLLLTDRYPSFELSVESDAIAVLMPPPGRLNRAAVFFRVIIAIPALALASLVSTGVTIASFFVWLIVLVRGTMPTSIFEAFAVVLRYQTRIYAYYGMLTSEYAWGLFGERSVTEVTTAVPMDDFLVARVDGSVDDIVTDLPAGPAGGVAAGTPRITRLVLSKAAKRLVVLFIVIGVLSNVATTALSANGEGDRVADRVEVAYEELARDDQVLGAKAQSCAISGGITCLQDVDRELAASFVVFRTVLEAQDFPSASLEVARELQASINRAIVILDQLSEESDAAEYQRIVGEFQDEVANFNDLYNELIVTLRL